jgi:hypothetical protein
MPVVAFDGCPKRRQYGVYFDDRRFVMKGLARLVVFAGLLAFPAIADDAPIATT